MWPFVFASSTLDIRLKSVLGCVLLFAAIGFGFG